MNPPRRVAPRTSRRFFPALPALLAAWATACTPPEPRPDASAPLPPAPPRSASEPALHPDATHTVIAWTQAGRPTPSGGEPGDIGSEFWAPRVRDLRPLRAYTHQLNLVLVTNRSGSGPGSVTETGWYLTVSHSSFLPASSNSMDGFRFPEIVTSPTGEIFQPDGPLRYERVRPAPAWPR